MIIASQKRKENIAEYVLYMWQIEDLIRANSLDIEQITNNIINQYHLTEAQRKDMIAWYESLIDMMRREDITKSGHLQINKNIVSSMADLHLSILKDPKFAQYTAEFYKTLPYIVELRAKAGDQRTGEIETCLTALYGTLMLRLQRQEISSGTQAAIKQISHFLAILSHYYKLNDEDKLFDKDEQQ
jgi:hypothetical protein